MYKKFLKVLFFIAISSWVILCIFFFSKFVVGALDALRGDLIRDEFEQKKSDQLLSELNSFSSFKADKAYFILIERKDPRVLPYVLNNLKSWNKWKKISAIQSLADMNEIDSIPLIVNILEKQKDKSLNNELYRYCLSSLAILQYEPIWPIAVNYIEARPVEDMLFGAHLLSKFSRKDVLLYLSKARERIAKNDYTRYFDPNDIGPNGKPAKIHVSVDNIDSLIAEVKGQK